MELATKLLSPLKNSDSKKAVEIPKEKSTKVVSQKPNYSSSSKKPAESKVKVEEFQNKKVAMEVIQQSIVDYKKKFGK